MWSMFLRVVEATMCAGDETVALLAGDDTQTDPAEVEPGSGGGTGAAAGKGATPAIGPWAMATCTVGQLLAPPPVGPGLLPPDVGVEETPVFEELGLPPQAVRATSRMSSRTRQGTAHSCPRRGENTGTHLKQWK
jgi:hypothetical protein